MTGDPCLVGQNSSIALSLTRSIVAVYSPSSWERQTSERASKQASKQERLNEANCLLPTWQTMAPENAGSPGIFLLAVPSSISFLARSDFLPLWLIFPRLILIGKRASMAGKFLLVTYTTYSNYYYH